MPRRAIATENRVGDGGSQFPRLKFQTKGERKRILIVEVPWQEYVHSLRAPGFADGVPKMTTRERRGEEVPDFDCDFIGMPLCLGDAGTEEAPGPLVTEGTDPANCPICREVAGAPAEARLAPVLRFAVNVVDQELKPGTWEIRRPYSASVAIWTFTSGMYDELIGLQEQHGSVIQERDVTLECTNPGYQQVKMGVLGSPGWVEAKAGAYLKELLETPGNVATEDQLRAACGRSSKRSFMEEDVKLVIRRWQKALRMTGLGSEDAAEGIAIGGGQAPSLQAGVDELLNGGQAAAAPDQAAQVAAIQAAKAEVRQELQDAGVGNFTPGTDIFTPGGEDRALAAAQAQAAQAHGADVNPFAGALPSPGGSPPAGSPNAGSADSKPGAPAAPASSPTASPHPDSPFPAAPATPGAVGPEPTTAPSPAPTPAPQPSGEAKAPTPFDALIAGLGEGA